MTDGGKTDESAPGGNDGGPVGEDELHAYVDGALPPARMARVEAWLAANPAAAARVQEWRRQTDSFHRLFDPVLDEPMPERLRPAAIRARRRRPALARVAAGLAAGLALLAIGLAGGWWLHASLVPGGMDRGGPAMAALASDAMSAHRVFAVEVRHPVEVPAAEHAHLVGWLSKRLGMQLHTPDLQAAGFALVGGRLLPAGLGPAAQFMYEDAAGQRLTLYLRAAGTATPTAFRFASAGAANAFYWTDAGLSYALVGEIGRDRLSALADLVYRELSGNRL